MTKPPPSFDQTWQRMLGAINAQTDSALAHFLSITPAGVSSVKKKQKIPSSWFDKISLETGISRSWLVGDSATASSSPAGHSPSPHASSTPSSRPQQTRNVVPTGTINVAEVISKAIEILGSKTDYAETLVTNVNALHKAMLAEKQIAAFNTEMMEAFAAFQKKHQDRE
ncbi:helix-turn-helix domain-containing protein [Desulfoplanes sp.]